MGTAALAIGATSHTVRRSYAGCQAEGTASKQTSTAVHQIIVPASMAQPSANGARWVLSPARRESSSCQCPAAALPTFPWLHNSLEIHHV
jgi:hypothetical protein